jgi:hypothetical protein
MQKQMKRNFVLDQLRSKGITHSQEGTSIDDLSYDDLKYLLVLSAFKDIDTGHDSHKWF